MILPRHEGRISPSCALPRTDRRIVPTISATRRAIVDQPHDEAARRDDRQRSTDATFRGARAPQASGTAPSQDTNQQILDGAKIDACHHQPAGEGVPEAVPVKSSVRATFRALLKTRFM